MPILCYTANRPVNRPRQLQSPQPKPVLWGYCIRKKLYWQFLPVSVNLERLDLKECEHADAQC